MALDLFALGFKHGDFAMREQTLNLKRNIVMDVSNIIKHIKGRPTSADRPEIEGRLCDFTFEALSRYREGFVSRRVQNGASADQAMLLFPTWVRSCMDYFFTRLRFGGIPPRMTLPAEVECAPFTQPFKKPRLA